MLFYFTKIPLNFNICLMPIDFFLNNHLLNFKTFKKIIEVGYCDNTIKNSKKDLILIYKLRNKT